MKYSRSLVTALVCVASSRTHAAYYEPISTIVQVRTSDPALWGDYDFLKLNGVTSAGNCATEFGLVLVRLPHSKAFTAAPCCASVGQARPGES